MISTVRALVGSVCLAVALQAQAPVIRTYAGGFIGDGGLATQAAIYEPRRAVVAPDGTIYIADIPNYRVRRVTTDGRITTYAGTGEAGYTGNGGPATQAQMRDTFGVAMDSRGNVYVSEVLNGVVRRISPDGRISLFAGNGRTEPARNSGIPATATSVGYPKSLAVDRQDNVYICDQDYNFVYRVTPQGVLSVIAGTGRSESSGDNGLAIQASLNSPADVAVDAAGNIYISERLGHRIRRINPQGVITTFAGNGQPGQTPDGIDATFSQFNRPHGLFLIGNELYVADSWNHRIKVIRNGTVTTVAGTTQGFSGDGGPALQARFNEPMGVTADAAGNLIISDTMNRRLRRLTRATGRLDTIAGAGDALLTGDSGPALGAFLLLPSQMYLDPSGSLLVSDPGRSRVRIIDRNGLISTFAGSDVQGSAGDGGPANQAQLNNPNGIAGDGRGTYYIADSRNHRIRRVDSTGRISTFAGTVQGYQGDGGPAAQARFNEPWGVALNTTTGDLFIADTQNHCIRRVDRNGQVSRFAGVCAAAGGFQDGEAATARFNQPRALVVGPDGSVFVADSANNRVRRILNNTVTTYAGNGRTNWYEPLTGDGGPATGSPVQAPSALAIDAAGNLFVCEEAWAYVRRVDARTGIITRYAGRGDYGYAGDEGPALDALLYSPNGLAVDRDGTLYIGDFLSGRVRVVSSPLATTLVTFQTSPPGLRVLVNGREVMHGTQLRWIPGAAQSISAPPTQGSGDTRYVFRRWSSGDAAAQQVTAPAAPLVLTAFFDTQFRLTADRVGEGTLDISPVSAEGGFYPQGATVRLAASPAEGWNFNGFSGDAPSGETEVAVTMSAPRRVVANFAAPAPDLSLSPAALTFRVQQGAAPGAEQLVTVASTGAALNFVPDTGASWLRIAASADVTPAVLRVTVNPAGLAAGTYRAALAAQTPEGTRVQIPVSLEVSPAAVRPELVLSSDLIEVSTAAGTRSETRSVNITSSTGAPVRFGWRVLSGAPFLNLSVPDGASTTPAQLRLDLAPSALAPGTYPARIEVTSPDTATQRQIIAVNLLVRPETPRQLSATVPQLSFRFQQPAAGAGEIPPAQTFDVTANAPATRFFFRAAVAAQQAWLVARVANNELNPLAPAALTVSVNPAGLTPGLYEGAVELRLSAAGDVVARVPVRLEVAAPQTSQISMDRTEVRLSAPAGVAPQPLVWSVNNRGTAPVSVAVSTGDSWVNPVVQRPTAGVGSPAIIRVDPSPVGLPPGVYASTVVVSGGGQSLNVPVVLTVNPAPRALVVPLSSVTLEGRAGAETTGTVELQVTGADVVPFDAAVSTTDGGDWLRLESVPGDVAPGRPARVGLRADGRNLTADVEYFGRVRFTSPLTNNTEEVVIRAMFSSQSQVQVRPAGVILTGGAGREIQVSFLPGTRAAIEPVQDWIRVSSATVELDGNTGVGTFTVQMDPAGLPPGPVRGSVKISFPGRDPVYVGVTGVATAPTGSGASAEISCTANRLLPIFSSSPFGVVARPGVAVQTDVAVVDNCGRIVPGLALAASFSSGDRPVDLQPGADGIWRATWTPRGAPEQDSRVEIRVDAAGPEGTLPVDATQFPLNAVFTSLRSNAPVVDQGTPFASPGLGQRQLAGAPGGRVVIQGQGLADTVIRSNQGAPVLGTTGVTVGGTAVPVIAVSPTTVEIQLPPNLPANVTLPVVISRGRQLSTPERLSIAQEFPVAVGVGAAVSSSPFQTAAPALHVLLTGVSGRNPERLTVKVGDVSCQVQSLQPVRGEPGIFLARVRGCGNVPERLSLETPRVVIARQSR
jgi:sugar lactone lactonase YvrE